MAIELPKTKSEIEFYNPKMILLFGKPKSGKSTICSQLENNLIIDLEDGYRSLSVLKVQMRSAYDLGEIVTALRTEMNNNGGKYPYKYITIDNCSRLEEQCLSYAAQLYRNTPMGANWEVLKDNKGLPKKDQNGKVMYNPKADIRTLPNGAGYQYLRTAIKSCIDMVKPLCETLILVGHVKDKQIMSNGTEMSEMSIDLAGKTGSIICGEADAIGYVYRDENKTIISFENGNNIVTEARPLHLRGKKFIVIESDEQNNLKIDLSEVFLEK